jgi:hypothetical protein
MGYKIFKDTAEVFAWAKTQFPQRSFTLQHIENDRYLLTIKGKGKVQKEVVYVKWQPKAD